MDLTILYMLVGFFLAAYSVIGNDSVQTLGTLIASNEHLKWYWLWGATSFILILTLGYAQIYLDGDLSFGRLNQIPWVPPQWYHAIAPLGLVLLTRFGIPVSTTFLVLSTFASTTIIEQMLVKSMLGYGLAAVAGYAIWFILERFINEKSPLKEGNKPYWRLAQWVTSGILWFTWLSHDMANIVVYLPRHMDFGWFLFVIITCVSLLGYIFYNNGGTIQRVVIEKHGTRFARSATIINIVYALILLYFNEYNDIPMSTTWVFVGMLCGRELAISTVMEDYKFKYVFPIVARDFLKMMIGLAVSVSIVLAIHYM